MQFPLLVRGAVLDHSSVFQLFMTSLFSVRKQFFLSILMTPLLVFTIWFGHYLSKTFDPLSTHVNLSSIREVQRGGAEAAANALLRLRDGEGDRVRPEQASLAKRRYAAADETLFVAQRDSKTDYREPPQCEFAKYFQRSWRPLTRRDQNWTVYAQPTTSLVCSIPVAG